MYVPKILHNKVIKMVSPLPLSSGTRRRKHSSEYFKASMRAEWNGMVNQVYNCCTTRFHRCQKFNMQMLVQILVQVQNSGASSKCWCKFKMLANASFLLITYWKSNNLAMAGTTPAVSRQPTASPHLQSSISNLQSPISNLHHLPSSIFHQPPWTTHNNIFQSK